MSGIREGIFAAILTPLRENGEIDTKGLAALAHDLMANGCDGIALFGTTGEAASFSLQEREHALEAIIDLGVVPDRLLVGTGYCSVPETVWLTKHAVSTGCAGALMLPPFYYKGVTDEGLYAFFCRVIEDIDDDRLRLYLYNFPEMTGVPLSRDLVARLHRAFPSQVVGIKDSSGDLENMATLVQMLPNLTVLAGDDDLLLPLLRRGGKGSITAGANIASPLLATIYEKWREDSDIVRECHETLEKLWSGLLLRYPVTEALKELLWAETGNCAWLRVRPPLARLNLAQRAAIMEEFDAIGLEIRPSLLGVLPRD